MMSYNIIQYIILHGFENINLWDCRYSELQKFEHKDTIIVLFFVRASVQRFLLLCNSCVVYCTVLEYAYLSVTYLP